MNNISQYWAAHHAAGFSTFPLVPNAKKPSGKWKPYQTERPTIEQVEQWALQRGDHNIGIATGAISGIVVLDLDSADAVGIAKELGLPDTVEAHTPRGRHLYFKHPNYPVPNVTGGQGTQLPKGIDVRGDGGYVVAAGSHYVPTASELADGKREGSYNWRDGFSPAEIELADMPDWLVASYNPAPSNTSPVRQAPTLQTQGGTAYGLTALKGECDRILEAPKGTRNDQLNKSAHAIARLVAGDELDEQEARSFLEAAAIAAGLDVEETEWTINSAWEAGSLSPRSAPEPQGNPPVTQSTLPAVDPLGPLRCASDASQMQTNPREWLIDGWLPVGATTTLFGDGGVGKSLVAMQMAAAVGSGKGVWDCDALKAPVLALYCEDDDDELARRQQSINAEMKLDDDDLTGSFYQSRFGLSSLLGSIDKATGAYRSNDLFEAIKNKALALNARLVILDNVNMVYGDDINSPGAVTRFMSELNGLALAINGSVLLIGHLAKAENSKFAGTAAWSNACRNRLFFGRPEGIEGTRNPDLRRLVRDKSNYAKTGEELDLMWERGVFKRPADMSDSSSAQTENARDDCLFLKELDRLTEEQQALSIHKTAKTYAPRVMAQEGNTRYTKLESRMARAMGRLLTAGKIVEAAPLPWKSKNRVAATGIARADSPQPKQSLDDLLAGIKQRS